MGIRPRQRLAVSGAADRALSAQIAHARLANPDADVRRLEAELGSSGRAMIALVRNADPELSCQDWWGQCIRDKQMCSPERVLVSD